MEFLIGGICLFFLAIILSMIFQKQSEELEAIRKRMEERDR